MIDPVSLSAIAGPVRNGAITSETANPIDGTPAGDSFAEMLAAASRTTINNLTSAESVSTQALQGDMDARQVVEAVMEAERSLQTAIAIRDKLVTAYLEISRMTI